MSGHTDSATKRSTYPTFAKGQLLESKTHGRVEFLRMDHCMGEVTYEFKSLTFGGKYNWLPETLDQHLYPDAILANSPGALVSENAELLTMVEHWRAKAQAARAALQAAKQQITADRQSLFDCHKNPVTGKVEDEAGLEGIAEYDAVLALIAKAEAAK